MLIAVALAGLVVGFLLANAINRNEITTLRAEFERMKAQPSTPPSNATSSELSEEEIAATIQRAEQNPNDFQIQRSHGIALYRYAAMKQNVALLEQAAKILERASALQPGDYDVTVGLGNAYFDIGYFSKNNESLAKAREVYSKGLAAKPGDVEVRTDIGLAYYLETPPNLAMAESEFKKSLEKNPRHEKTLVFMVEVLAKQNKTTEAAEYLDKLRSVNPQNQSIAELNSLIVNPQPRG
jgi:tetratricopeptide (TPR) repeat protein